MFHPANCIIRSCYEKNIEKTITMYGGHRDKELICLKKKYALTVRIEFKIYIKLSKCAGTTVVGTMYTVCVFQCLHRP